MFYEKQKAYSSARLYYNDVIQNYSNSKWAAKALERIQVLDNTKKK